MKLPIVVSPGTWDLLERLRPDLDVAVDVFDTKLAPLLDESSRPWAVRLREVAASRAPDGGRAHLRAALRTGRHALFTEGGFRVGLFPIRCHKDVVGVLAAAAPEAEAVPVRLAPAGLVPAGLAPPEPASPANVPAGPVPAEPASALPIAPENAAAEPPAALPPAGGPGQPQSVRAAGPADGAASAIPEPVDEALDRRIERIGWSLRAAVEADVALWERLDDAGHRARWAEATLRFLEFLHACASEGEVFTALIQAAAVWGDLDARVYRRTLSDSYVADSSMPEAETSDSPASFSASVVDGQPLPVRITALAELEHLGWRRVAPEVLLIAVGPADWPPMWVLALAGPAGGRFDSVSGTLARTASLRIEQLLEQRATAIAERLRARLLEAPPGAAAAMAVLLHELVAALPAARARLLVQDEATGEVRALASAGGLVFGPGGGENRPGLFSGPSGGQEAGPILPVSPEQLLLPLAVAAGPPLALDLTAPRARPFCPADAFVARRVARWLEAWLAGAWHGLAVHRR
jgi:hypothetical protein